MANFLKHQNWSIWRILRWILYCLLIIGLVWLLSLRGVRILLQTAALKPDGAAAQPALQVSDASDWTDRRKADIRQAFEQEIYGRIPLDLTLTQTGSETLSGLYFEGQSRIERRSYSIKNPRNGQSKTFDLIMVLPASRAAQSMPVILAQSFCPNDDVVPVEGIPDPRVESFDCGQESMMSGVFTYFFGRYITTPPFAKINAAGYAYATVYPTEFIADSQARGPRDLAEMFGSQSDIGALAAWSAQLSLLADTLKAEPQFSSVITYGHSRFGKTALIAAAFNPDIDAVIAHQSGTGGASLSRDKPGETVADILGNYPYWFSPNFRKFTGQTSDLTVDQHQLLALIAPRPILLGNARRDVWSDPNGAYRAARAADSIYEALGTDGLTTDQLDTFDPGADISFWIRPGTHGVVKEDWDAFLEFLGAQDL